MNVPLIELVGACLHQPVRIDTAACLVGSRLDVVAHWVPGP